MTTLNAQPLLALSLVIPRLGAWTADVAVDSDTDVTGAVTLDLEGRIWRGTVVRGAVAFGRWSGRIVGGAGGLQRELPPVAFAGTTHRAVFDETLRAAGETAAAIEADLSAPLNRWHRVRQTGDVTIAEIARATGLSWRVLSAGFVWLGVESWVAVTPRDVDVMSREPITGCYELAGDAALDLEPGTTVTLDGTSVRIGAVTHRLDGVALRTSVLEEREDVAGGRLMAAFEAVVRRITRRLDYSGVYSATVVQQHASGRLDLRPEDPRRPSCADVPYRTLPGLTVEIPAGSLVSFTYENADPRRPVVVLWEPSTEATRWAVNGSSKQLARTDDTTANGKLVFGPTGTFVAYVAPGGLDVLTPPGGSIATLTGVLTGSSIIRG